MLQIVGPGSLPLRLLQSEWSRREVNASVRAVLQASAWKAVGLNPERRAGSAG